MTQPKDLTAIECQQLQERAVIGDRLLGALGALVKVRQIVLLRGTALSSLVGAT